MSLLVLLAALAAGLPTEKPQKASHACIHDDIIASHKQFYEGPPAKELEPPTWSASKRRGFAPIRIHVDTSALSLTGSVTNTCYTLGQLVQVPCSQGICQLTCAQEHLLTQQKVDYIENILIPGALATLEAALDVNTITAPLTLPNSLSTCGAYGGVPVPSTYRSNTTAPAADLIIFVSGRPTSGATLAYATHCLRENWQVGTGRPVAGQINFGLNALTTGTDEPSVAYQVGIALHEITHVLGISGSLFPSGTIQSVPFPTSTGANSVSVITSPTVVNLVRAHFNCPTLAGAEVENGGSGGTVGSHWEKRIFWNELMTGTASLRPEWTQMTLALLQDTTWYQVHMETVPPLSYGKNLGCAFVQERCSGWADLDEDYFCTTTGEEGCVPGMGRPFKGNCNYGIAGAPLPTQYQYFTDPAAGGSDDLADYCPLYIPSCLCTSEGTCLGADSAKSDYGEEWGDDGTCVLSRLVKDETTTTEPSSWRPACQLHKCRDGSSPWIKVGPFLHDCTDGGTIPVCGGIGYKGHLTCPDVSLCSGSVNETALWPTFTSIDPDAGLDTGGETFTIRGSGFTNVTVVYLGAAPVKSVTIVSSTQIVVVSGKIDGNLLLDLEVCVGVADESGRMGVGFNAFAYQPSNIAARLFRAIAPLFSKYPWLGVVVAFAAVGCCCCCVRMCKGKQETDKKKKRLPTEAMFVETYGGYSTGPGAGYGAPAPITRRHY